MYRLALALCPAAFRRRFGGEMQDAYDALAHSEYAAGGALALVRLQCRATLDAARTALREHGRWQGERIVRWGAMSRMWWLFDLGGLGKDASLAFRQAFRQPVYSGLIVGSLALGIGINTAIFSGVSGVLIKPLPFAGGDRLVVMRQIAWTPEPLARTFSVREAADLRERSRTVEAMVEYHGMSFHLLGVGEPQRVRTGVVSATFFDVLGVEPAHGRTFVASDESPDATPVLVLSHEYWSDAFAADPRVVGRVVEMNDKPHTIVGILPPLPRYPRRDDVYMPTTACPFRVRAGASGRWESGSVTLLGLLREGATVAEATAELGSMTEEHRQRSSPRYRPEYEYGVDIRSLRTVLTRTARPTFLLLSAMSGFVLLLVCANVANLTLSRLVHRQKETAVFAALGAGSGRLWRQQAIESLVLAGTGGVLGVLLASASLGAIVAFADRLTERASEIAIDGRVLLFSLTLSVLTGLVAGSIPALPSRANLAATIGASGAARQTGPRQRQLRSLLVVAQVALSVVLLVGAGLTTRSLYALQRVDPGFDPHNVLTLEIDLDWDKYDDTTAGLTFIEPLLEDLRDEPGVVAAAVASHFPLTGTAYRRDVRVRDRPSAEERLLPAIDFRSVSPAYLEAIGTPLLAGRNFTEDDAAEAPYVALVNERMREVVWAGDDPAGAQISWNGQQWATIVGVVGDVRQQGLDSDPEPEYYLPFAQATGYSTNLVVRTVVDPTTMERRVKELVYATDPEQPVALVRTLQEVRAESIAPQRLTAVLLGSFAALALAITVAGIAGVVAFTVRQQRCEIGLRMALGARRSALEFELLQQGMARVVFGLMLGVLGAALVSRWLAGLLYEVGPMDPLTFVGVCGLLLTVALLACFLPTRRATALDPMSVLRDS